MFIRKLLTLRIVYATGLLFLVLFGAKNLCAVAMALSEFDEVVNYEIFPFSEYEKLGKLKEQESCKTWANRVDFQLKCVIYQLENAPGKARAELVALDRLLTTPPESGVVSMFEGQDRFTAQSVAAVLKGRVVLWNQALSLLEQESADSPYSTFPRKGIEDINRLYEFTDTIRSTLLLSQNGRPWIQFFQLTPLHTELGQVMMAQTQRPAEPVEKYANEFTSVDNAVDRDFTATGLLSEAECQRISLLVNNALLMRERTALTPEQQQLLDSPLFRDWLDEMETWRSNPLHPLDLLAAYESYRQYRGTSDSSRLSVMINRMLASKNRELQAFGQTVQNEFSNAHLKIYVSRYLINLLLPKMEPENGPVREIVAGQEVTGRRRTETQLYVTLIPDPNRLLMQLNVNGKVTSQTTSSPFPTVIHTQGQGTYSGTKQIELTSRGIVTGPANVTANTTVKLSKTETDFDIVPIVSDLIRGIAKDQYDILHPQIQSETNAKILTQARQRIDNETDARFREMNERLDQFFFNVLRQRQISFEPYQAKTTEEWLLTSWYLATSSSLGSDSKEPAIPMGSIADLKIHELGINAALERFELAGKQMTLRELKRYLVTVIGQPNMILPEEDNDHVVIGFADLNPVGVRFHQNRVEILLNLKRLQAENRVWSDFCVIANYVPDVTPDGTPCLALQGSIQLDGQLSLMQQVALRTIFSKIFLHSDTLPLRPKLFDADPRFASLTTGNVRIENGWFAIAMLQQETPMTPKRPTMLTRPIIMQTIPVGNGVRR